MDRPIQRTNRCTIYDSIEFLAKPCAQKPAFFRDLYLTEGLSASQIAHRTGCSKTFVLKQLRKQGIQNGSGRRTDPNNYKLHDPPYGFSKKNGQLAANKVELRICRIVVELDASQGLSARAIGKILEDRGIKTRKGVVAWSHGAVRRILDRWKGKL